MSDVCETCHCHISSDKKCETCGVYAGKIRGTFAALPKQSALRRPLVRMMLDGLTDEQLAGLDLPLKTETVRRYRNEEVDMEAFLAKRRHVEKVTNEAFERKLEKARTWVTNKCGITPSGRTMTTHKTELVLHQLFERYQKEVAAADQVSINPFGRVTKELHVHFGVGPVDTMTCVICREWGEDVVDLETRLLTEVNPNARRPLEKKLRELAAKLEDHQKALKRQRRAWEADLNEVQHDPNLVLCVVDFSTFELMDRKQTSVLCVVVVDAEGEIRRRYFDFVDVKLSGRKRDGVFFALSFLYQEGVFSQGQRVRLWSDAGSGDFRNAPCLFSFLQLNSVCKGVTFESFNYFGARHGWSDCDRHFGTAKNKITRWLVEEASSDRSLLLDVLQCAKILAGLENTEVFGCSKTPIDGVEHPSIKGLTKNYSFRFVNATTAAVALYTDSDETQRHNVQFGEGRFLPFAEAKKSASLRKNKK